MTLLLQKGARVSYSDPFVPTLPARAWHGGQDLASVALDPATLADVDCVAILTDHSAIDYAWLAAAAPLVVDSRNAVKERHPHVFRLGAPAAADIAVVGANRGEEAA
jgi:UDP-N-acetyl-D-glucosamine dehydrogenase